LDKLKEEFVLKKKTLALVPNEKDALEQIKETVASVEGGMKEAKVSALHISNLHNFLRTLFVYS